MQLHVEPADRQRVVRAVGAVRPQRIGRQKVVVVEGDAYPALPEPQAELAPVDDEVVAVGGVVALKARDHVVVPDNVGQRLAALGRVGSQRTAAADMVDVSMGVQQRVDAIGGPAPQRINHRRPAERPAGVEAHQAVVGAEGDHVAERLDHGDVVVDLAQCVIDADDLLIGHSGVDQSARQLDGVDGFRRCHDTPFWVDGRSTRQSCNRYAECSTSGWWINSSALPS